MRKFFRVILYVMMIMILPISSAHSQDGTFEALSPKFLEWQAKHNDNTSDGLIPFPVDLSYLADNPPDETVHLSATTRLQPCRQHMTSVT